MPEHHVVLCADDFGLTEGVSRAILDLARAGRVSATSVMSHRPWWPRLAPEFAQMGDERIGVGLHLTLSLGRPLGAMPGFTRDDAFPGFPEVLRRSVLGRLPVREIRDEIDRQLDAFEAALGRPPDFVDGHQHVHVLPGIRAQLIAALAARGWRRVWLRDPSDRIGAIVRRRVAAKKGLTVRALAAGFAKGAWKAGFAVNQGFSGFSPFDPARDLGADFTAFLEALGPAPVVMCHPGHVDAELRALDPVVEPRAREYAYLTSDDFGKLLRTRGVTLVPRPLLRPRG